MKFGDDADKENVFNYSECNIGSIVTKATENPDNLRLVVQNSSSKPS